MTDLPKTFDPADIEARWAAEWEADSLFRPDRPDAEPFTLVNPPPNVTGALHIGHALDNTLQDVIVRYERMRGKDVRWVVGTDHAGIATQMVVERQLAEEGLSRAEMGREAFLERVWAWKAESGDTMGRQLRRLGCSMDWANERFTMDEGMSAAVVEAFVRLHEAGLVYRDKRLVNWDPALGTAISDLEVETREVAGHFWHLTYPLADGSGAVSVATTRPETLLADMAVAVHPDDERYAALIGRTVRLPLTGREVPIVADEHADPALGSGAVKITPGHDFNDFDVGRRAGIEARDMLNMLDATARVVQTADGLVPDELIGLDRDEARAAVVRMLEDAGALERTEARTVQQPVGDRSGTVIEPWLTDQWYVDAGTLAGPAMASVRSGEVEMVPASWEKTFFHWMENIQPWCVSRQLWWGHRIPAWFADDGRVFVARSEEEARTQAGGGATLTRDPDVLDTWFSSALWPFATLGWPEDQEPSTNSVRAEPVEALSFSPASSDKQGRASTGSARTVLGAGVSSSWDDSRTPNDLLISGFDILFFWDARMMMMAQQLTGKPPFKRLYLHGLVRAADGRKMSKSKGNTVDPIGLIDRYGADALRFFMTAMESQGRDVKMDEARLTGYRNFATKIWNAARFLQANGVGASADTLPPRADKPVNRWILAEAADAVQAMELALADLRFDAAADAVYHFAWDRFCDWYLELIKGDVDAETRAVAAWTFDCILKMLHPIMPFVTEELWALTGERPAPLIVSDWSRVDARSMDAEAAREMSDLIELVREVRGARSSLGIPPGAKMALHGATAERWRPLAGALERVARIDALSTEPVAGPAAQLVVDGDGYALPLAGVIDLDAERARLAKAVEAAGQERDALAKRLANPSFVERAKPEAVAKARADHADRAAEADGLAAALARLG